MDKKTEINNALKDAMKGGDQATVGTLRLVTAGIKQKEIDARGTGKDIGEPEIMSILQGMIKQRKESITIFRDNKREDLATKEEAEVAVIERFLPAQMDDAATAKAVEEAIASTGAAGVKDMGKVMNELKSKYAGQLDMGKVGGLVKSKLG